MTQIAPQVDRLDLSKAVKQKFVNGLTDQEIGDQFGVTRQAVNKALKPFKEIMQENNTLQTYQDNYTKVLRNSNMLLMGDMLNPEKRKAASLNNIAYAWDKIATHLRLEENKSTENVSLRSAVDLLIKDSNDLNELKESLINSVDNSVDNSC